MPPRRPPRPAPPSPRLRIVWLLPALILVGGIALLTLAPHGDRRGGHRARGSAGGQSTFDRLRSWAWGDESNAKKGDGSDEDGDELRLGDRGADDPDSEGGAGARAGWLGLARSLGGASPSAGAAGQVGLGSAENPSAGTAAAGGAGGAAGATGAGAANPSGSALPDAGRDPKSDTAAPTLVSVVFDPPEVKDGAVSTARFTVTDDLSGVQLVNGLLSSPGGATVSVNAMRVGESDVWAGAVAIPKNAEAGVWWVSTLSLSDKAANTSTLSYSAATAPPGARLTVQSSSSDTTAPVVRSITLAKPVISDNDTNTVIIDVSDDRSGVGSVYGTFESPKKMGLLGFSAQAAGDGAPWTGQLPIPKDAACGEWRLRELHVVDKANNRADLDGSSGAVSSARFTVYSSTGRCDSNAPTVRSTTITPRTLSNESDTPITISLDVTDDASGIAQVTGYVAGPTPPAGGRAPNVWFTAASSGAPDAPWTATVVMPKLSAKGTWRVTYLQVADQARNIRYYNDPSDPGVSGSAFEVR